jgi:putative heme-binding domain-containing protein
MRGDTTAGNRIFAAYCANCHRVNNVGKTIGPDLSQVYKKFDNEQLLRAIIFPDEAIQFGYAPSLITRKDKLQVYGFVVADAKNEIIVRDISGQNIVVKKVDMAASERLPVSIMPSAAQFNFTDQDLADVTSFLTNLQDKKSQSPKTDR